MPIDRADAEEWALWFRALADATRLQVLNAIATYGPNLTIGELVARVEIGQSTVLHHVRVLAEVGYVMHERIGASSADRADNEGWVREFVDRPLTRDVIEELLAD